MLDLDLEFIIYDGSLNIIFYKNLEARSGFQIWIYFLTTNS